MLSYSEQRSVAHLHVTRCGHYCRQSCMRRCATAHKVIGTSCRFHLQPNCQSGAATGRLRSRLWRFLRAAPLRTTKSKLDKIEADTVEITQRQTQSSSRGGGIAIHGTRTRASISHKREACNHAAVTTVATSEMAYEQPRTCMCWAAGLRQTPRIYVYVNGCAKRRALRTYIHTP